MARVRFLNCLCVFNEASHAEADGGGGVLYWILLVQLH